MDQPSRNIVQKVRCLATASECWTVADLLDFEHIADADRERLLGSAAGRERIEERDRHLYVDCIEDSARNSGIDPRDNAERHRRLTLRHWLEIRRNAEPAELRALLPGQVLARTRRISAILLTILGIAAGIGIAGALLGYGDDQTINVTWYLLVLVGAQLAMVLIAALFWLLRQTRLIQDLLEDLSVVGHLIRPLFLRVMRWVQKARLERLTDDLRERTRAEQGLLQARVSLHGPAYTLIAFMLAQWFGIGFNLGVLTTTSALIAGKDLAFGWETSHDGISAAQVAKTVRVVGLPWGWYWGEGVGYPSAEQIEATRTFHRQDIRHIDRHDLHSWRWLLILSVLTYGLLPRIALLGLSIAGLRRTMATIPISGGNAVYGRLITPSARFEGPRGDAYRSDTRLASVPERRELRPDTQTKGPSISPDACALLVHVDLAVLQGVSGKAPLQQMLMRATGWRIEQTVVFGEGSVQDRQALALVRNSDWQAPPARIAILMDGTDPPIIELETFLAEVRGATGNDAPIHLCLVSSPSDDQPLRPIRPFHLDIWRRKIQQMADPFLEITPLAGIAEDES